MTGVRARQTPGRTPRFIPGEGTGSSPPRFPTGTHMLALRSNGEVQMRNGLKTLAIAAALAAGTSGAALAQSYGYACPAGYAFYNGVCQPMGAAPGYYAPSNP